MNPLVPVNDRAYLGRYAEADYRALANEEA